MGLLNNLASLGKVIARSVIRDGARAIDETLSDTETRRGRKSSTTTKRPRTSPRPRREPSGVRPPSGPSQTARPTATARRMSELPGPGDTPVAYSIRDLGMPDFRYTPRHDNRPDPGEVVWTWVPYEEDASQGKDRPVLVVAEAGEVVVFAQLTSKDHDRDAAQEAARGRHWIDIGSGNWDSKGRESEARIDRLLCVHPSQVRRGGGTLDGSRFTEVIEAIRAYHD